MGLESHATSLFPGIQRIFVWFHGDREMLKHRECYGVRIRFPWRGGRQGFVLNAVDVYYLRDIDSILPPLKSCHGFHIEKV